MANEDSLGDRMKRYEDVTRTRLTRRVPVMMRLDGKAFHTFTRGLPRPYCRWFHCCMWAAASYLCENIQGAQIAYVQSDEITILVTDYEAITTEAWYDYQVQKMASVAAAMCSVAFMREYMAYMDDGFFQDPDHVTDDNIHGMILPLNTLQGLKLPAFDARVWNVPKEEVVNAFLWRQQDATRNAIQSLGQAKLGHGNMQGLKNEQVQERLFQECGINFNDMPVPQKRGVCIVKETYLADVPGVADDSPIRGGFVNMIARVVERTRWVVDENIPLFTQDRQYIQKYVDPKPEA